MAKKTGKRNQHVAAFISKLLLGAAAVSFASKLTLAEEIQKDSLDWNAAYYNNSYEKFVTESELGYYIAVNNYLYFVEKESLTPILSLVKRPPHGSPDIHPIWIPERCTSSCARSKRGALSLA